MNSKNETKTQSSTKREPWEPAHPIISGGMNELRELQKSDAGKYYYPGQTYAGMSDTTGNALDAIENRANSGSELTGAANDHLLNTINGVNGPANDFYQSGMEGGNNLSTGGYNRFMDSNSPSNDFYSDIASGGNPYLDQTFDHASDKISDAVNSNFSKAGRYGSTAHQGKLSEDLGNFATNLYGSQYNSDMNRRMGAANALDANYRDGENRAFNATNAVSNIDGTNVANQYAAADRLTSSDQYGRNAADRAAYASPSMAANDYADYDRLIRTGAAREGYAQQPITDEVNRYNYENNTAPFQRAGFFGNQSGIYGNLGETINSNSTTTQQQSGLGPAIGNAMGFGGFASQFLPSSPGMNAIAPPSVPNLASGFGVNPYLNNYGAY